MSVCVWGVPEQNTICSLECKSILQIHFTACKCLHKDRKCGFEWEMSQSDFFDQLIFIESADPMLITDWIYKALWDSVRPIASASCLLLLLSVIIIFHVGLSFILLHNSNVFKSRRLFKWCITSIYIIFCYTIQNLV